MSTTREALIKELPQGWEQVERHVELAVSRATDRNRKCPPTEMFVFVREMMCFNWKDGWRTHPEGIAYLLEDIHEVKNARFRESYRKGADDPGLGDFWQWNLPLSDGREEFIAVWISMRFQPGVDPLRLAMSEAFDAPIRLEDSPSLVYETIVNVAFRLQRRVGDREILLPQQRIAEMLGVSQRLVSTYIGIAVKNGFLRVISGHNYGAKQAKLYRFDLTRLEGVAMQSTSKRV